MDYFYFLLNMSSNYKPKLRNIMEIEHQKCIRLQAWWRERERNLVLMQNMIRRGVDKKN